MELKPDKGLKNGSCNVTACQKPGAVYFNKSTRKYYCAKCAEQINWPGGRADVLALYGTELLCELDEPTMSPEAAQEAQDVKARYGATHYATMKDGVTPQMYYKQEHIHYNDNTSELVWVYLSYCNLWVGSSITEAEVLRLKAID